VGRVNLGHLRWSGKAERRGILIGVWDEAEIPAELWSGYLRDKV